jgi:hypothetical protein
MSRCPVHWELDGKLLCGVPLDTHDDRFLLDPRWIKHVTCAACVAAAERLAAPSPPAAPECKYVGRCNSSRCEACNPRVEVSGALWTKGERSWVRLDAIRALLATQGLSIVEAKDRAVLDERSCPRCGKRPIDDEHRPGCQG